MNSRNPRTQPYHIGFYIKNNNTLVIRARKLLKNLNRFRGMWKYQNVHHTTKSLLLKDKKNILARTKETYKLVLGQKNIKLKKVIVDCK